MHLAHLIQKLDFDMIQLGGKVYIYLMRVHKTSCFIPEGIQFLLTVLSDFHYAGRSVYTFSIQVSYYVDCLCITSKYLSEVLKKVSRYAANYWINRYTIFDISRLLSDKSLSFVQISDMFSFSSQAYLSRYVQQNLGFNPTEYRT